MEQLGEDKGGLLHLPLRVESLEGGTIRGLQILVEVRAASNSCPWSQHVGPDAKVGPRRRNAQSWRWQLVSRSGERESMSKRVVHVPTLEHVHHPAEIPRLATPNHLGQVSEEHRTV
jgi:hypothetical protein